MGVELSQESRAPRDSGENAESLAKAESWLSFVADQPQEVGDQEALVYLRSRGRDCHEQVTALIQSWKAAEQVRLDEYNRGIVVQELPAGGKKRKKRDLEADATNVEHISPIRLRNFWDAGAVGDYCVDATRLRTVDWCEISGFDPWWRRLVHSRKEGLLQGGIEEPAPAAYWLFNMVRSDYAIGAMPGVLSGYLESISLPGLNKRPPWLLDSAPRSSNLEHHGARASAIVFAHHRLPSRNSDLALLHQAVATISKCQDHDGAWRTFTSDTHTSIESTAMALHTLAFEQPPGWPRIAERARNWLWSVQQRDGSSSKGSAGDYG